MEGCLLTRAKVDDVGAAALKNGEELFL